MKKITIIGHFGFNKNLLNGQTIKTKTIASELELKYGKKSIYKIDTSGNVVQLFFSFIQLFFSFFISTDIVFLPAKNGLKVLAPLILNINIFFKRKIHYVTIGGWLYDFLVCNIKFCKKLKKINCIYVETQYLLRLLHSLNFTNVILMPNCKRITILDTNSIEKNKTNCFKLCTFSRVSKEKGIETAIDAVCKLNLKNTDKYYSLDIYGSIDANEKDWFEKIKSTFPHFIKYCGEAEYNSSSNILSKYDVLLFPTFYEGEGFAGTIIDAFSAGLPVIASDWKSNSDIVHDEVGYIFETKNANDLSLKIEKCTQNSDKLFKMKINCLEEARKYKIDCIMEILFYNIEFRGKNKNG